MSHQFIPLHRLVASADNVRRTDKKPDIDQLAASIEAHGLLQNLTVQALDNGRYAVVAGARRHAALKQLAKSGVLARDFAVPCQVIEPDDAQEVSLAENVQRVAMNAMDEVEAFAALLDQNLSPDDIARRFGCTLRHVQQRLALASLSAKVKAADRRGEITLGAARAFTIEPSHEKQDAVLRALGKAISSASSVRTHLMQGAMRISDRLVRFVGLDAYENAGGAVMRDLFDPDTAFVSDPALVTQLAQARLSDKRDALLAQGWGWVEINLAGGSVASTAIARRIYPTRRAPTKKERRALSALEEDIATLQAALDESEDDLASDRLAAAEARRAEILRSLDVWDNDLIAYAGVTLGIDYDGALKMLCGLVRKSDKARIEKLITKRAQATDEVTIEQGAEANDTPPWEIAPGPRYPKSVVEELTAARTRALRTALRANPQVALALAVHALNRSIGRAAPASGILISAVAGRPYDASECGAEDGLAQDEACGLESLLRCNLDDLLVQLAALTAAALDLTHRGETASDHAKQIMADTCAEALALDMTAHWRPSGEFWARLPKALLLDILRPALESSGENGNARMRAYGKLKRSELADVLAKRLDSTSWLPAFLRTPSPDDRFELTPRGAATIAVGYPQEIGAGLTVVFDAKPLNNKIILIEPTDADLDRT